jgi:hypothetical protein
MERLENSLELDAVAKVILSIMKLVQQKSLDIGSVREVIRKHFPGEPTAIQREYMGAAITYISYKYPEDANIAEQLRSDMALAHPIHPQSEFARKLREEHAKGIETGIERGIVLKELHDIEIVQGMLGKKYDWAEIQEITHIDREGYATLLVKHSKFPATMAHQNPSAGSD